MRAIVYGEVINEIKWTARLHENKDGTNTIIASCYFMVREGDHRILCSVQSPPLLEFLMENKLEVGSQVHLKGTMTARMYNGYPSISLPVSGINMASSFHLELLEPPSSAVVGDGEAHAASKGNLLEKFKSHLAKMDEQPGGSVDLLGRTVENHQRHQQ